MRFRLVVFGILFLVKTSIWAENWPHWRGPTRDGVSREVNLPTKWNSTEPIVWKLPMPAWSGSTPIIWGDRIFLNSAEGGNRVAQRRGRRRRGPRTEGRRRDIQADYGMFGLNWGYASSPLLYNKMLYIQVLHGMKTDDPSYVLGIDALSGSTQWRVERPTDALRESPDSYTTPVVLQYDGKTEIVVTGGDYATGHDPRTGEELWRAGGLNPSKTGNYRIIASPLVLEDIVYVPSRRNPLQAFRGGGSGDVTESHRLWQTPNGPDVPTPVTDGKYLYILRDNGVMFLYEGQNGPSCVGTRESTPWDL